MRSLNPRVITPATWLSPLVLDSPHSGTDYPTDFAYACSLDQLRQTEDFLIDEMFNFAPSLGAPLISAPFPRSYLDLNRAPDDIDPELLSPDERAGLNPTRQSNLGVGIIWRLLKDSTPIYGQPLTRGQIEERISRCWHPYHEALARAIDTAHRQHGHSIHINCHSMPAHSRLYPASLGHHMPFDFLIGNRDNTTSSAALSEYVAAFLRAEGFVVGVNQIYKGVELVRRYGEPEQGRHSIQLEVKRTLYMDEQRHAAHDGFPRIQSAMRRLVHALLALKEVPL